MKKRIISIISGLSGLVLGLAASSMAAKKEITKNECDWRNLSNKHLELFLLMNQWVKVKQEEKNLALYLKELNIKRIAIYGMSYAGRTLLNELNGTDIQVIYGIDQNAKNLYLDLDIVTMEESFRDVDAIIVTAITCFDEIKDNLRRKINCRVISLEDLLYEV